MPWAASGVRPWEPWHREQATTAVPQARAATAMTTVFAYGLVVGGVAVNLETVMASDGTLSLEFAPHRGGARSPVSTGGK